jgi:hypothetical protein
MIDKGICEGKKNIPVGGIGDFDGLRGWPGAR